MWARRRRRRRDPGGRLGKAAGMDGDGTGYLKGKATPCSTPGHPFLLAALGVPGGDGHDTHSSPRGRLSLEFLGGLQEAAGGPGTEDAQHPSCQDAGCRRPGAGWPQAARLGAGEWITQHPMASSCNRGGKPPLRQEDPAASRGNGAVANSRRQRAIRSAVSKRARYLCGVELLGSLPF